MYTYALIEKYYSVIAHTLRHFIYYMRSGVVAENEPRRGHAYNSLLIKLPLSRAENRNDTQIATAHYVYV